MLKLNAPGVAVLSGVDDVEGAWLASGLDDAFALVAAWFFRREVCVRARACAGMLSGLERKTGWSLAEYAGEQCPAGVQRQYTGTAGKITNCQLGVFLAYAGTRGRALIDRELYLPRSWAGDAGRLVAAKVPPETVFATKPQLLQLMVQRAVAAGIPFRWVAADEAWQRLSCGNGAKGRRDYDWALAATSRPEISLLIRRHASRSSELAFYLCHTSAPGPAAPARQGRRDPLGRRGMLPGRQERGRPGLLPGQAL